MTETQVLTLEEVVSYLDKSYTLTYTQGYSDNLDSKENLLLIQTCIREQDKTLFCEKIKNDWFYDMPMQSVDYAIEEVKKELRHDWDEEDVDNFFEDLDNLRSVEIEIYNRDDSDIIRDLCHNSHEPVCFYPTGFETETDYDEESYLQSISTIKEALGIAEDNDKYDKEIKSLIVNATYGGHIVVYFTDNIEHLLDLDGANKVWFKDPHVAVIDTMNGSGDDERFMGLELTLDFDPHEIRLDKTINYSYTYDVCGMSSHWCDDTKVRFLKVD